ncbi:MAG: FlgD immunoglobulin-like domain containing protein [Candidatus Eiseniibacteriota bacterium]
MGRSRQSVLVALALAAALAVIATGAAGAVPSPFGGIARASDPPGFEPLATGWTAEGFINPSYEAQRSQVALDDAGRPVAIWAGRLSDVDPYQILYSIFDGTAWSEPVIAVPSGGTDDLLPQVSRADDGTLWLAWQRNDDRSGSSTVNFTALVTARFVGGTWSAPETVAVNLARPSPTVRASFGVEFSLLAVGRDSAWIAFARDPAEDPFSLDRDLYYAVRSDTGWTDPAILVAAGLGEARPVLSATAGRAPVVFFGFSNAPSILWAMRWNGSSWVQGANDVFTAQAIYEQSAVPDTNGAIRLVAIVREETAQLEREDHVRELVWNANGFTAGEILTTLPVLKGTGTEPPDWRGVSLGTSAPCASCLPSTVVNYRALWVDLTPGGPPDVFSRLRTAARYDPTDSPGTALDPDEAFPNTAYDAELDRWYAVWTAPPGTGARRRTKFSWTQEFAGDLAIGAAFVAPDTARVTLLCSGDATGREFLLYRLEWDEGLGNPPLVPPVPAQAVPLSGNPYPGPCPIVFDDLPGPGRYYYYVELPAQGTFPAAYTRSLNAVVIPEDGGGGEVPAQTALLVPRRQAAGGALSLPYDLASDGSVTITIYDLRGRLVREYDLGHRSAGTYRDGNVPVWNGADNRDRLVQSGIYFVRLQVNGNTAGEGQRALFVPTP